MRTFTLTTLVLVLSATPAWAIGGHGGGNNHVNTTLKIVNDSDQAVVVSANGGSPSTLEPHGSQDITFNTFRSTDTIAVSLTATIEGTSFSDTESATIRSGNRATATITCATSTSLSIAFSGGGLAKVALSRDSGVMLASSGGLLPLLWISVLLGRQPRRRESLIAG